MQKIDFSNREASKSVEEFRVKAIEAERDQMHYFLPYNEGSGKRVLDMYDNSKRCFESVQMEGRLHLNETLESFIQRSANSMKTPSSEGQDAIQSLSSLRMELVLKHREAIASNLKMKDCYNKFQTSTPAPQQRHPRSLLGLQSVTLRDLDISRDYVTSGRVLTVTIIEPPVLLVGIYFVVVDENDDAERLAIYNIPGQFPSNCNKFSIGTEIAIIEPYVRQCSDGSCAIRVDEPSSVMITGNQRPRMCRYCGKPDAPCRCSQCREAAYCNKTCQTQDWKLLKHKNICGKIV